MGLMAEKVNADVLTLPIKGKTEQRVELVIEVMKQSGGREITYDYLMPRTGSSYDYLLYILQTLVCVGLVTRREEPQGRGRPKVLFRWVGEKRARGAATSAR